MEPEYVTFESTHIEEQPEESVIMRVFIDGYPADENLDGTVIATVSLTVHGDIVTEWHHNAYRMNDAVLEEIEAAKKQLEKAREDNIGIPVCEITCRLAMTMNDGRITTAINTTETKGIPNMDFFYNVMCKTKEHYENTKGPVKNIAFITKDAYDEMRPNGDSNK